MAAAAGVGARGGSSITSNTNTNKSGTTSASTTTSSAIGVALAARRVATTSSSSTTTTTSTPMRRAPRPSRLPAVVGKKDGHSGGHGHGVTPESDDPPVEAVEPVYRYGDCVFIVNGSRYVAAPRQALKRLGWKYNADATSTKWDMCWAVDKIPPQLLAHQIVNRVLFFSSITTKSGLCEHLRQSQGIHLDTFYPRCAVIEEANRPESAGMVDMLQQYQRGAAASLLMKYLSLAARYASLIPASTDSPPASTASPPSSVVASSSITTPSSSSSSMSYPCPPSLMSASLVHSSMIAIRFYIQYLRHFNSHQHITTIGVNQCQSCVVMAIIAKWLMNSKQRHQQVVQQRQHHHHHHHHHHHK